MPRMPPSSGMQVKDVTSEAMASPLVGPLDRVPALRLPRIAAVRPGRPVHRTGVLLVRVGPVGRLPAVRRLRIGVRRPRVVWLRGCLRRRRRPGRTGPERRRHVLGRWRRRRRRRYVHQGSLRSRGRLRTCGRYWALIRRHDRSAGPAASTAPAGPAPRGTAPRGPAPLWSGGQASKEVARDFGSQAVTWARTSVEVADDRVHPVVAERQPQRGVLRVEGGDDHRRGLRRVAGLGTVAAGDHPAGRADRVRVVGDLLAGAARCRTGSCGTRPAPRSAP